MLPGLEVACRDGVERLKLVFVFNCGSVWTRVISSALVETRLRELVESGASL
jgi:hypothetical protein